MVFSLSRLGSWESPHGSLSPLPKLIGNSDFSVEIKITAAIYVALSLIVSFWIMMKMKSESKVAQSCPTVSDPMDCSLSGSSIHGIFQARVLEWGAIAFSYSKARKS